FGINLARDVMVPMRDGTRLATDLYRPAGPDGEPLPGPFPTILCRTPYDKTDRRYAAIADFFTPRGYVTVSQDLRGRSRSEGGAMQLHMFWALFMHAHDAPEIKDDPAAQQVVWDGLRDMRRWVDTFRSAPPLKPGETPLRVVPNLERILFDYYYRGNYDEFW